MQWRLKLATTLLVLAAATPAGAQIATTEVVPQTTPQWTFAVTPYAWLPTLSANMSATTPRGDTATINVSANIGQYLTDVNFAAMAGGEARMDRFTVMTDIVYMNASLTTNDVRIDRLNLGSGPINLPKSTQLGTGTRMNSTVWSAAAGYTLGAGAWGNLDMLVGMRMLSMNSRTNYLLTSDISAPDRTVALSRNGSLTVGNTYFNVIGGAKGRINIPDSKFYLPYYIDIGTGALPFTWQIYGGVAYKAADWVDVSLGYRYMTFQNNSGAVHDLSMNGIILAGNFRF